MSQIQWWERTLIVVFGLMVVGGGAEAPSPWGLLVTIAGWAVVAAAIGLVELGMAIWYRARRSR